MRWGLIYVLGFRVIVPIVLILFSFISRKPFVGSLIKIRPFECGFESVSSARIPFSIKFFLVVIIFLVFDVEIALILPVPIVLLRGEYT